MIYIIVRTLVFKRYKLNNINHNHEVCLYSQEISVAKRLRVYHTVRVTC